MRISGNVARSTSSKQRGHERARRAELGQHTALMGAFRKVHWDAKHGPPQNLPNQRLLTGDQDGVTS